MAGYMKKLQGYVYDGEVVNGAAAAVKNGTLMIRGTSTDAGKLVLPGSADTTTKLECVGAEDVFGNTGYRFVVKVLNAPYYFVENGPEYNDSEVYDGANLTTAVGKKLRAHPLLVGEEFVTDQVTGTITAGALYGVKADGTVG